MTKEGKVPVSKTDHSRLVPIGDGAVIPDQIQAMRREDGDYNIYLAGYVLRTSKEDWHNVNEAVWRAINRADRHAQHLKAMSPDRATLNRSRGPVVA